MVEVVLSGNLIFNDKQEIFLLFRKEHQFYETPGGTVEEVQEKINSKVLRATARRELLEEVAGIEKIISMKYFTSVDFFIPDGRSARAHKFITKVIGDLSAGENLFDKEKSKWLKVAELGKYPLSPDLKILLPKLKNLV